MTTTTSGTLRLVVESSSATAAATAKVAIQPEPNAKDRLRTSISGQRLEVTFGAVSLTNGATLEILIELSYHPAALSRRGGRYSLVYRFGAASSSRFLEGNGLVGVVAAPMPASGTLVQLTPEIDVAALWPTMYAPDNGFYGLAFTAKSLRSGSVADVAVTSCSFVRSRSNGPAVVEDQLALVAQYSPRFPSVSARPCSEIGRYKTHVNAFGIPQLFPDFALDTPTNHDAFFNDLVADVQAAGGAVSLNHPFGYNGDPLLPADQQAALRRTTYSTLAAQGLYGCDLLEVGYAVRGNVDIGTHLALWDTFSRNGRFVTGNGANDDHSGRGWMSDRNGFFTGAWAASKSDADLVSALRGGRAFFAHLGTWKQASLDLRVDDAVPMGSVLVSTESSHVLQIASSTLPAGATVEVIQGPADFSGALDPQTSVARVLTAADFSSGMASVALSTLTSGFWRVQVKSSAGAIIAGTNPVWILRSAPPGGIPAARRV